MSISQINGLNDTADLGGIRAELGESYRRMNDYISQEAGRIYRGQFSAPTHLSGVSRRDDDSATIRGREIP